MNNQENNWFRSPQNDMQEAENLQNGNVGQGQQQGLNDNNLCRNQGQQNNLSPNQGRSGVNCNNIPQNNGVHYTQEQMNAIAQNNKKLKMVIIALVCVVVLGLAAVACFLLMDEDDNQTPDNIDGTFGQGTIGGGGDPGTEDVYNVGDYITFGKYEQDNNENNGKEDIEWLVLDKKDGKLLVISKDILTVSGFINYHQYDDNDFPAWDGSNIRKEMNVDFYGEAFNDDEKEMISVTQVSSGKNPYYNIDSGDSTEDKLFLLSVDEIQKYLPSEKERKCSRTKFAEALEEVHFDNTFGYMWCTRSPGESKTTVATVESSDGCIFLEGIYKLNYIGVRPAMWIELSE